MFRFCIYGLHLDIHLCHDEEVSQTSHDISKKQLTICGTKFEDHQPLWTCKNAFVKRHKCVYVLCNSCHMTGNIHMSRGRGNSKKNGSKCDQSHKPIDLCLFVDVKWLKGSYLQAHADYQSNLPTNCQMCKEDIILNDLPLSSLFCK